MPGPLGAGPFILKELVPKESALLVKNEEYWNEGYPKADELRISFVGSETEASFDPLLGIHYTVNRSGPERISAA